MAVTGTKLGNYRCTAAGDSVSQRMFNTYIRWVKGSTAGHQCVVREHDASGDVLFEGEADGAHFTDIHNVDRWIDGFYVEVLNSGVVFVYTN